MPWSEKSPGHYTRPIGENESMIKTIGERGLPLNREHWSLSFSAQFKSRSKKDVDIFVKLHKAWKVLRFNNPSLASTAADGLLHYTVPDTQSLDKWTQDTFFVIDEDHITPEELIASFKPGPYVTLHYLPRHSQIVIHASHWRTDGIGAIQVLDAFFEAAASNQDPQTLPWGLEVTRLVPSVEEALNIPTTPSPEIKAEAEKCIATIALTRGAIGVDYLGDSTTLPAGTRSARLRLSESTTEAIKEACKARNISIIAAVHAAIAAVNYAAAPEECKKKPYTSTIRTTLRSYLPEPYNTPAYACGLYTSGLMFQVPASQSWLDNAEQYHHQYECVLSSEFIQARREYASQMLQILSMPLPVPLPTPSEVDISSIGDAELLMNRTYGTEDDGIDVLGISLGVETLTRQMYTFVWIFRGQLEFNLVYNEAYHDAASAGRLLVLLEDILETELKNAN